MKKMLLLLLLFNYYHIIAQYKITDNLLLHYEFNNNTEDSTENEYDGTASNVEFGLDRNGNENSVAIFNGIDSYVDLPNLEELKPELPVTIALWANFDNLTNEQSVLFTTDFLENSHTGIWSSLSNGKIAISYGDASGNTTSGNRRSKIGTTDLESNTWYHFTFIVRGETDMDIYINGVNDEGIYTGTSDLGLVYSMESGSLGRKDSNTNLPTYFFKGSIDDFKYWDRAIEEEDIEDLYNLEAPSEYSITDNLLLHYEFSNNTEDSTENEYDGTASNVEFGLDRNGNENSAAIFNGIDSYVDLPNLEELKPELPVTIALWANFDNLTNEQSVLFTTDFLENSHTGIWSSLSNGKIAISYGDASGNTTSGNRRSKIGTTDLESNTWYHFTFIVRGETDMDIYINGVNDEGIYTGTSDLGLGYSMESGSLGRKDSNTNLPTYFFKGSIDDFKYWDRALTNQEIMLMYPTQTLSLVNVPVILEKDNILIYPVPIKNYFNLKTSQKIHEINLYDLSGKKYSISLKKGNIKYNVDDLNSGIYMMNIVTKTKNYYKKIIIKK